MSKETNATSAITRISFDRLAPRLQEVLRPRVERLGYLGEFFQCTAHQPDILGPFIDMTEALKRALPDRLTEVGALTVARMMGNDYERHQHERLSCKLGFGAAWIAAVERLSPDQPGDLNQEERAVQRLVMAMIEGRGKGAREEFEAAVESIGADQALAILFLVGRYITHALIVNVLELSPPVSSIFEQEMP